MQKVNLMFLMNRKGNIFFFNMIPWVYSSIISQKASKFFSVFIKEEERNFLCFLTTLLLYILPMK